MKPLTTVSVLLKLIRGLAAVRLGDPVGRRRYFIAYCVGCLLGYGGYWCSRTSPGFPAGGPGDFTTFYTGALILRSGQGHQLYDLALQEKVQGSLLSPHGWVFKDGLLPFIYPPFFAILFVPFTYLKLRTAFHAWNVVSLLLLMSSLRILLGLREKHAPRDFWRIMPVVLAFFPVFEVFYKGQSTFLVLLGLTLAFAFFKRGQDGRAGFALALGMVKPQLLLVVAAVIVTQRRWRALAAFAGAVIPLAALSWYLAGTEGLTRYASLGGSALTWDGRYGFLPSRMANLNGTVSRLAHAIERMSGTPCPAWVLLSTTALLSAIVLAAVLYCWRTGWDPANSRFGLQFGFTLAAALLVTPYLFGHDLSLLVLAGFVVSGALIDLGRRNQAETVVAAGHIAFILSFFAGRIEGWAQFIVVALLGAMGYLLHASRSCSHHGTPSPQAGTA